MILEAAIPASESLRELCYRVTNLYFYSDKNKLYTKKTQFPPKPAKRLCSTTYGYPLIVSNRLRLTLESLCPLPIRESDASGDVSLTAPALWLPRFAGIRKAPNRPLKAESGYISSVRDMSQYDVLRSYLRASFTRSLGTICSWKV